MSHCALRHHTLAPVEEKTKTALRRRCSAAGLYRQGRSDVAETAVDVRVAVVAVAVVAAAAAAARMGAVAADIVVAVDAAAAAAVAAVADYATFAMYDGLIFASADLQETSKMEIRVIRVVGQILHLRSNSNH